MAKRQADLRTGIDFCMEVYREKNPGSGEDSYFYMAKEEEAIFGVFDGCGGSGARRYDKLQGKTGAFMASRVIAGAVKDWFVSPCAFHEGKPDLEALQTLMRTYLDLCKEQGDSASAIKGKLMLAFPTTAAIVMYVLHEGRLTAHCVWAGDSRCYKLDASGLMQLTEDDNGEQDAFENLTTDGVLTNVISAAKEIRLHTKQIELREPCFLFAATDGCFGYLSTPMEFEYLLLDTLLLSASAEDWERRIDEVLQTVAGDDYTLCGAPFGFGGFERLKAAMGARHAALYEKYIRDIEDMTREEKRALWQDYAPHYTAHLRVDGAKPAQEQR